MRRLSGFSLSFQKLGFSLAKRENPASPAGAQEEENQGSLLPIQHSENQRTVNCPKGKRESSRGYLCRATRWSGGHRRHLRILSIAKCYPAGCADLGAPLVIGPHSLSCKGDPPASPAITCLQMVKKQPQTPCGCFYSITRSRAPPAPWRCHAESASTRPCRPERRSKSEHR